MLWRERGSNTIDPTENQQSTLQLVVWCMVDTDNHIKPNYQKLMVCCTHKAKCQMIIKIKIYRLFKHLTCSEKEDINVLPCCFVPTWLAEERIMFLVAKTWKCLVGIWHITTQCKLDSISVEKKSVPRVCQECVECTIFIEKRSFIWFLCSFSLGTTQYVFFYQKKKMF